MSHRYRHLGSWRRAAASAFALAAFSCGDGVGRPIVALESSGERGSDAGFAGSPGDDAGSGAGGSSAGGSSAGTADAEVSEDDYCAAVAAWPPADAEIETQIVAGLNGVRFLGIGCTGLESGDELPLLSDEAELRCAARVHTMDMIERGYFDHVSPEGEGPDDRIERAGYPFGVWAEVIGELDLGTSSADFRDVLSEESEDCGKLLNPSFDAVGVGYYQGVWTIVLTGPIQLSP